MYESEIAQSTITRHEADLEAELCEVGISFGELKKGLKKYARWKSLNFRIFVHNIQEVDVPARQRLGFSFSLISKAITKHCN